MTDPARLKEICLELLACQKVVASAAAAADSAERTHREACDQYHDWRRKLTDAVKEMYPDTPAVVVRLGGKSYLLRMDNEYFGAALHEVPVEALP